MTILILSDPDDAHARHVAEQLEKRDCGWGMLDSKAFPSQLRLTYEPDRRFGSILLADGRRVPWDAITSVYWRSYDGVASPPIPNASQHGIAQNDSRGLFESMLIDLPACWVNSYRAWQLHRTKPVQLQMVASLPLPDQVVVTPTLVSNDPQSVIDFVQEHQRCIFKPVQGGAHTQRLTHDHLQEERLRHLDIAPITLQPEIKGNDVRVFVAGDELLACQIDTEALDFRDDPDPSVLPVRLPVEVQQACHQIAERLELRWTGIDLRRTDEDLYFFLEANPSPMFLGFQRRSDLPLTNALLSILEKGGKSIY